MPVPRYAISYTPPPDAPLARFGASVLGYDCFHRVDVPHRVIAGIDPAILALATVEPRRHGFQGALIAPFALDGRDEDELREALVRFARSHRPIPVGPLTVAGLDRCVVLRPAEPHARLDAFADECLETFDPFRAPADNELPAGNGDLHEVNEFRFHMTLAGPIPDSERKAFKAIMRDVFGGFAADQIEVDAVSLMKQDDPASRFHVLARQRLSGR